MNLSSSVMYGMGISLGGLEIATDYIYGNSDMYEPELSEVKAVISNKPMKNKMPNRNIKPKLSVDNILDKFKLVKNSNEKTLTGDEEIIENGGMVKTEDDFEFSFEDAEFSTCDTDDTEKGNEHSEGEKEEYFEESKEVSDENNIDDTDDDTEENEEDSDFLEEDEDGVESLEDDLNALWGDEDDVEEDTSEQSGSADTEIIEPEQEETDNLDEQEETDDDLMAELFGDDEGTVEPEQSTVEPEQMGELFNQEVVYEDTDEDTDEDESFMSELEASEVESEDIPQEAKNTIEKVEIEKQYSEEVVRDLEAQNTYLREQLNKVKNLGDSSKSSENNNKKIKAESRLIEKQAQAVKVESRPSEKLVKAENKVSNEPVKTDAYSQMNIETLYANVKRFLVSSGVNKGLVSLATLNQKFGEENIKKLIKKSYLILIGKGVTVGR